MDLIQSVHQQHELSPRKCLLFMRQGIKKRHFMREMGSLAQKSHQFLVTRRSVLQVQSSVTIPWQNASIKALADNLIKKVAMLPTLARSRGTLTKKASTYFY